MINLLYIGIGLGVFVAPLVLTLANIINLFKKKKIKENMIEEMKKYQLKNPGLKEEII